MMTAKTKSDMLRARLGPITAGCALTMVGVFLFVNQRSLTGVFQDNAGVYENADTSNKPSNPSDIDSHKQKAKKIYGNTNGADLADKTLDKLPNLLKTLEPMERDKYFLRPLKGRHELPLYLQQQPSMRVGAEIGVQAGVYSEWMLRHWTNCRKYYLIDLWAPAKNYRDYADVSAQRHSNLLMEARARLVKYENVTEFIQGRSDEVVNKFEDESLDFLFVDARHDYCAVKKDLELWWPKVRQGGILTGHDYMSDEEVAKHQDWTLCEDGTREPGAVIRAVDEFALERELIVSVMYREQLSNSYMIRKPYAK